MQALILAAGRGSRLGEKSDGVPKCLLEVGRRPLIEHQLETLAEAGIGPVGMVLGYCADDIREVVGIRAEYILNARWSVTNSLYSFWLARDWVSGPLLVLNSDILVHPEIITRLLAVKGDALAYDSSSGHGLEHMKVKVVDAKLTLMGKNLAPPDVSGENVGVLCFSEETVKDLFGKAGEIIAQQGEKQWLGSAVSLVAKERPIRGVDVAGLPWGEADFAYDLDRLRKEVWPAIRRERRKAKVGWRWVRWAAVLTLGASILSYLNLRSSSTVVLAKETLELQGVERLDLATDDRMEKWWLLDSSRTASFNVTGPHVLEIESRVILQPGLPSPAPYVLEVNLDGKRLDWFKETAALSQSWRHADLPVGKQKQVRLPIPSGIHQLQIRLVASDSGKCLIRVRRETPAKPVD